MDTLRAIVKRHRSTFITPREFFIAWKGIPVLVYQGFSPAMESIKREIEAAIPGLLPENPGSRWPKTTLGALEEGRVLSLGELRTLRHICNDFNAVIKADAQVLPVRSLSVVLFQTRSLEKRLLTASLPLREEAFSLEEEQPTEEQRQAVTAILRMFEEDCLEAHLPEVQKPGHRADHYRESHVEATLVFDLGEHQPPYLDEFIRAVEEALPGYYAWFSAESRHLTLRALVSGNATNR